MREEGKSNCKSQYIPVKENSRKPVFTKKCAADFFSKNIVKEVYLNGNKAEDACELLVKNATNIWKKENTKTIDDISCAILFLNIK